MKNINKLLVALLVLATLVVALVAIPASAEDGANESLLPEAEVTDIRDQLTDADPLLTFALNFKIKDYENFTDEYIESLFNAYGDYYVDYILTVEGLSDDNVTFNANGGADGYLAGQYDDWSDNWVTVPFEDVTINNGDSLYIMEYAASLMGKGGLRMTLEEIATVVMDFDCGIFFTDEFLAANHDMKVTLQLVIFDEDAEGNVVDDTILAERVFYTTDAVDLPEAQVSDITNPDLTFALNFQIKDVDSFSERYLNTLMAVYGEYYVDYVITIKGLSDADATFNANGGADGYLAGQYDAWSTAWVNVPFDDVTINNGDSLYIMETAAGLMGKQGLRFKLWEIAEIVKDFDCGIFFEHDFLVANPEMEVVLELKIFREVNGEISNSTTLAEEHFFTKDLVDLPEAEVTDISDQVVDPDLTYALNFKIKDFDKFSDEYIELLLAVYGNYYVDYVISIEGLIDSEAVFNANGGEGVDGFLAGQYDAWSENWVCVPFENTSIPNNGSLYIMETAAKMLGESGLRYKLWEIAEIVKDFDCGIYFTPEFMANNPDMIVTLELIVFKEDAEGNTTEEYVLAKNVFGAKEEDDGCNHIFEIKDDGHLYVSTDDGLTWKDLGQVVGNDGNDGTDGTDGVGIDTVVVTPIEGGNKVTITLTNGNTFVFDVMNGTDGEDGKDGEDGEDGEDGKDGVTPKFELRDDGHLYVSYDNGASWTDLGKVVGEDGKDDEDGEDGAPGQDGEDGKDGEDGTPGQDGEDGEDGKDGLGIASIEINANGELIITYTDGTSKNLGNVMGSNGSNGADGEDGKDGEDGAPGADGEDGKDGVDGKTPSFKLDENGDLFIRYSEDDEWTLLGNIKGQTGDKGDNGADGEDGKDGLNIQIPTSNGNLDTIVLIIIAAVSIVAIATVAIVVLSNRNSYCKPWWLI